MPHHASHIEGSTEIWLRSLAEDVLDHSDCEGCRANAQSALDMLGEAPAMPTHDDGGEPGLHFEL